MWLGFLFKQKAAYEVRISDWSADVFSSDLDLPGLDGDGDRRRADPHDVAIAAQHVANGDRPDEGHRLDADGDHAAAGAAGGGEAAGDVHLAEHPAAEDIAVRIGVRRHGGGAGVHLAARLALRVAVAGGGQAGESTRLKSSHQLAARM